MVSTECTRQGYCQLFLSFRGRTQARTDIKLQYVDILSAGVHVSYFFIMSMYVLIESYYTVYTLLYAYCHSYRSRYAPLNLKLTLL